MKYRGNWKLIDGVTHLGYPIYVDTVTWDVCYEEAFSTLVDVPDTTKVMVHAHLRGLNVNGLLTVGSLASQLEQRSSGRYDLRGRLLQTQSRS